MIVVIEYSDKYYYNSFNDILNAFRRSKEYKGQQKRMGII